MLIIGCGKVVSGNQRLRMGCGEEGVGILNEREDWLVVMLGIIVDERCGVRWKTRVNVWRWRGYIRWIYHSSHFCNDINWRMIHMRRCWHTAHLVNRFLYIVNHKKYRKFLLARLFPVVIVCWFSWIHFEVHPEK